MVNARVKIYVQQTKAMNDDGMMAGMAMARAEKAGNTSEKLNHIK